MEICSEMLESQRLFELCVRKMITAPLRGPLGDHWGSRFSVLGFPSLEGEKRRVRKVKGRRDGKPFLSGAVQRR